MLRERLTKTVTGKMTSPYLKLSKNVRQIFPKGVLQKEALRRHYRTNALIDTRGLETALFDPKVTPRMLRSAKYLGQVAPVAGAAYPSRPVSHSFRSLQKRYCNALQHLLIAAATIGGYRSCADGTRRFVASRAAAALMLATVLLAGGSSKAAATGWHTAHGTLVYRASEAASELPALLKIVCGARLDHIGIQYDHELSGTGQPWLEYSLDGKPSVLFKAKIAGQEAILDRPTSSVLLADILKAHTIKVALWFGMHPSSQFSSFTLIGLAGQLKDLPHASCTLL